jgi:hypothetical protein
MSGSYIFASLNSRLESDKEEEEDWRLGIDHPALIGGWGLGIGDWGWETGVLGIRDLGSGVGDWCLII